jgi:Na+-transporting methylmalonyl-CoA/oxaloacetate decarboxylase gamma subunit
VNNDMKPSQVAKPSTGLILSPTLRRRTRYAALMMLGIGMMLAVVAGSVSKDEAAAVGGWGVGFLLLSVLLLGVIGIAAVWGQLVRVAARDVKNELPDERTKNTAHTSSTSEAASNISETSNPTSDDNELSDMERALIKLLRNNDIPPDVFAESLREVLERRMGS